MILMLMFIVLGVLLLPSDDDKELMEDAEKEYEMNSKISVSELSSTTPAQMKKSDLAKRKRTEKKKRAIVTDEEFNQLYDSPSNNEFIRNINNDDDELKTAFITMIEEDYPKNYNDSKSMLEILWVSDNDTDNHDSIETFIVNVNNKIKSGNQIYLALDTAANRHIIKDVQLLSNYKSTLHKVIGVSGEPTQLDGVGDLKLNLLDNVGNEHSLDLKEAYGLEKCPYNLMSVDKLIDDGCIVHLDGSTHIYYLQLPQSQVKIPLEKRGRLFMIKVQSNPSDNMQLGGANHLALNSHVIENQTTSLHSTDLNHDLSYMFSGKDYGRTAPMALWHLRNRHIPISTLKQIHSHDQKALQLQLEKSKSDKVSDKDTINNDDNLEFRDDQTMVYGFQVPHEDKFKLLEKCDVCYQAKLRKRPQLKRRIFPETSLKQGYTFSTDLKSMPHKSFYGHKYVICFVEHETGLALQYVMKHKSETTSKLIAFINDCKKYNIPIAKIQSDRGTEYFEQEAVGAHYDERALHKFRDTCKKFNIIHTVTPVGDKEKFAERWIKEHSKTIDTYLWNSRLSPQFWTYAIQYSSYQANRTPRHVNGKWFKDPIQFFTGEIPRWDKWKVFGCDAFSHIPNNKHAKQPGIPTGQRSIFVGFDNDGGALLFDINKRRHIHSNNVYFNESFKNRHNALHYYDQRRALLDKDAEQPLQINDFDAVSATQVRNLYMNPAAVRAVDSQHTAADTSHSRRPEVNQNNVSIGGDEERINEKNSNDNSENNTINQNQVSHLQHTFSGSGEKELQLETAENGDNSIRPLRLLPVGNTEKWSNESRNFLRAAINGNYKVSYLQPCPKKGSSPSATRYKSYMFADNFREARELGATSADIKWDYMKGYIQFPNNESSRSGHVFSSNTSSSSSSSSHVLNATLSDGSTKPSLRQGAFNEALKTIDEEVSNQELLKLLDDRIRMIEFAESKANRLMAMSANVDPTSNFVDWHIAAEPTHYNQTQMSVCSEWKEWENAMNEEIASLKMFKVYEEISIHHVPKGRQILGCKWVYKRKRDKDGNVVRYRARVVALGFRQKAYDSFHPDETYSPVVSKDTLRMFLSISAKENLTIYQADVKAAFLQAPLTEEIYMKVPPGQPQSDKGGGQLVWKLKRAVYGLKQASACFWTAVNQHLVKLGYHSLTGDPCLFQKNLGDGKKILVCCYVDDITFAVSDPSIGEEFLKEMRERFFIGKDEGKPIEWLLGMAIQQNVQKGTVSLHMSTMIDKLANLILTEEERVKSSNIHSPMLITPLIKLSQREISVEQFDYLSVVGSLLHIANCVRCDIAFAVSCLARYSMTPGKQHVKAAKRVVQYLYNTKHLGITYYRDSNNEDNTLKIFENGVHPLNQNKDKEHLLKVYGDSDYAMDYTRRSTMGIVIMLNGGPVSWTSVLGKTVATSTCEAEVNAAVTAVKDSVHFKLMMVELGLMNEDEAIQILEDNSACIAQASQGLRHIRNAKHYEVKLRFLQQRVVSGEAEFVYCPTEQQLADFFTKPLDETKFIGFRDQMMSAVSHK
jgi:hypothetical protein